MSSGTAKKRCVATRSSNQQSNAPQNVKVTGLSAISDDVHDHYPRETVKPNPKSDTSGLKVAQRHFAAVAGRAALGNDEEPVIEISSSDEDDQIIDAPSVTNVADSDVKVKIEPGYEPTARTEGAIHTRSSSGIVKKRFLKDAAFISDDEDLPFNILPLKKSRLSIAKPVASDVENNDDNKSIDVDDVRAPVTPVRRANVMNHVHPTPSAIQDDVGLDESPPTRKAPSAGGRLKTSKGKSKAVVLMPAFQDESKEGEHFTEDDESYIKAIEESRREMRTSQRNSKAAGGSSAIIAESTVAGASSRDDEINNADGMVSNAANTPSADAASDGTAGQASVSNPAGSGATVEHRRTFRDVFPETVTTPMITAGTTLYEKGMTFKVTSLPQKCEVSDVSLQEPDFASDYPKLPPLRAGSLKPWGTNAPPIENALVSFRQWAYQCPEMDYDLAHAAVSFVRYKHFLNPCRASFKEVNIVYTQHDHKRAVLQCNFRTAVCLTPILLAESYLIEPITTGLQNKFVSGYFHKQEWQRFEGFSCMVFNRPSMTVQTHNDCFAFFTMGPKKDYNQNYSPSKPLKNPSILSPAASKKVAKRVEPSDGKPAFRAVLDYTDEVPIYDAREHPFNFASDLDNINTVLPRYNAELPQHSFVVVGYTMGMYEKDRRVHLATNILFAILIGTE